MSIPIVFVGIDANSRLQVLQTPGVGVITVDWRVDPAVTLWPQPDRHEFPDIMARIMGLPLMSPGSDDQVRSALHAIRRVRGRDDRCGRPGRAHHAGAISMTHPIRRSERP